MQCFVSGCLKPYDAAVLLRFHVSFVLGISQYYLKFKRKISRNFYFTHPKPLKQPLKKPFLRRKGLACLSGGESRHEFKPAAKMAFLTGSLAQPNLRRGVVFLCLLSLTKQRK
ncbi:MAG: hypothetical protein Q4G42_03290 [Neisseria sp.]|nr:hypothetical protein [Neisseria sp.]